MEGDHNAMAAPHQLQQCDTEKAELFFTMAKAVFSANLPKALQETQYPPAIQPLKLYVIAIDFVWLRQTKMC